MRIKRLLFYATVSLFAIFLLWFVITNGKYMQMCNNKFLTLSLAGMSNKSLSLDNGLDDSNKSITDSTNETTVSETVSDSITDLASTNTDTTGVTNTNTDTTGVTNTNTDVNTALTSTTHSYLDIDVYDVTWGDTLSGISRLTGVSVDELAQLNHIANPNLIYSGSSIKIRQTP